MQPPLLDPSLRWGDGMGGPATWPVAADQAPDQTFAARDARYPRPVTRFDDARYPWMRPESAALYARITAPPDLDAAVRAAEHHLAAGRRGEALALLERWQPAALRPGAPPAQRRRALLLTAELLRREPGSRARAAQIWAEVCRISPGDPAAHEALAKHLEHSTGDLAAALEVARSSAAPCPRRLVRLQRKLIARLPAAAASRA